MPDPRPTGVSLHGSRSEGGGVGFEEDGGSQSRDVSVEEGREREGQWVDWAWEGRDWLG